MNGGFTIIELMAVLAVMAILVVIAVPAFLDLIAKNKVKTAAEEIYGLVLQARSETPIRDRSVTVSIADSATPWCIGLNESADPSSPDYCDCSITDTSDTDACVLPVAGANVLQVISGASHPSISISEDFTGSGPTFRLPRVDVDDDGTIEIVNGSWQLDLEVSPEGRIKVCNPNSNNIPGYAAC